jgi:DNA-binding transcriptional MerR regulator
MTQTAIEPRPLYGIGTVARLAKIKTDTLRVWERRYGLGASHKSDSGRRLYTQTDLEHLQIVGRLVRDGYRIGEIASLERKTLAAIVNQGTNRARGQRSDNRPTVMLIGIGLGSWLDQHPACLSGLDSRLLRSTVEQACADESFDFGQAQLLMIECAALNAAQVAMIEQLQKRLGMPATMVFYEFSNPATLKALNQAGLGCAQLPLDVEMFSVCIRRLESSLAVYRGNADMGELAAPQPRLFKKADLAHHRQQPSELACGCSQHLAEIIETLANFESYSSECGVENWQDAATHACVYAYANQARWLMEKALGAVIEEHQHHAPTK